MISIGIVITVTIDRLPEIQKRQELKEKQELNGPFEIEEEFLGPNQNNVMYLDNIKPDEINL